MANAEQRAWWRGEQGHHWVEEQARFDRMLDPFNERLVSGAVIAASDRVLDVGCGCGTSTRAAARAAASGSVLGVDLSDVMLERAREVSAAEGITNARFEQADAQNHAFDPGSFDAAISRFGVMFFDDPHAAFANIARSLRSDGRMAFGCFRAFEENDWVTIPSGAATAHVPAPDLAAPGEPGPFSLADPERIAVLLAGAGLTDIELRAIDEDRWFGSDLEDALGFVRNTGWGRQLFSGGDPAANERALAAVRDALVSHAGPDGVTLGSACWLVTARRAG